MAEREGTPTKDDLLKLPRWARVAFVARCAKRVQALLLQANRENKIDEKYLAPIDVAISLSLAAALAGGCDANELREAAQAVSSASVNFAVSFDAHARPKHNIFQLACRVAASAAKVAALADDASFSGALHTDTEHFSRKADRDASRIASLAASGAVEGVKAFGLSPDLARVCWSDYARLMALTESRAWTDESPVDPTQVDSRWPESTVTDKLGKHQVIYYAGKGSVGKFMSVRVRGAQPPDSGASAIEVWIDRGDASAEQLEALLTALSEYHVAHGGLGLEFIDDGTKVLVREAVPAC